MRRRAFLGAIGASAALPAQGWAAAGNPRYLAAARHGSDRHVLHGLRSDASSAFSIDLPERGHAAAAHPYRAEAVAIARRPGTFAFVVDCLTGSLRVRLAAPEGRHFYGHGVYTADGSLLLLTENQFEDGDGRISLWDVENGYERRGDIPSGGIGPHEILRRPDGGFAIANGGIRTHPDTGREKLNLDTMAPNLTLMSADLATTGQIRLPTWLKQNSIRHLAVRSDGLLALAMQWNGLTDHTVPPIALVTQDASPILCTIPESLVQRIEGYVGSVAFSGDGRLVAATAPRGDCLMLFDAETGSLSNVLAATDICGVARHGDGLLATQGTGDIIMLGNEHDLPKAHPVAWDNHLVALY
ncbi:DUF1513 domain-containing protein [Pontivivens ytuae]|uniref:DUF1513 domain-containing protein n=1 Tax=Pontivivens ytuae TaxID=2789856 RepID=A0A7S9QDU5_9RHOB|nr:DUF1513 domain-containing protein [Pontivivens ytuae]QPH55653.1 DUF1513 domain-containing protein [Pontivivens ytuae]